MSWGFDSIASLKVIIIVSEAKYFIEVLIEDYFIMAQIKQNRLKFLKL
jgi:hypothetical protein